MTTTETIKALRDALSEADIHEMWNDALNGRALNETRPHHVASFARAIVERWRSAALALTADASDQAPAKRTTADYSLDSALAQMRGLYALMIEFKVPHARAANSAAHVESAIRHLHRIANATDTARPAPVAATPAPDLWALIEAYADARDEYAHSTARHLSKTQRENVEHAKAELASALVSRGVPCAWRVRVALDGEPCRSTLQDDEPVAAEMEQLRAAGYQVEITPLVGGAPATKERHPSLGQSLLRPAISAASQLPPGCFCPPDKCSAPKIMGRQTPCRREFAAAPAAPIAEVTGEPVLIGFDLASGPDTGVTDEFPQVERLQINLMELVEDSERNQPCAHGSLVDGHAVYCHNGTWKDAPRKCRRTWYTGGETRDQDCEGFAPNANSPAAEHAKPEPVVMGLAQDEAASGKQAAKHHGDAQSNQALISVTGHFGHRQVATPAPRSDAHAKRADVASERDSFEVYWRKVDLSPSLQYQNRFEINCEGNYLYVETRLAWETWQARGQQAGAVDGEASCR